MAKLNGGNSATSNNSKTSTTSKKPANLAPGTYWDIQLGAFGSKDNAKEFARKVSRAGFKDIVLQTVTTDTGTITRVAIKKVPATKVPDTQSKLTAAGFTSQTLRQRKD